MGVEEVESLLPGQSLVEGRRFRPNQPTRQKPGAGQLARVLQGPVAGSTMKPSTHLLPLDSRLKKHDGLNPMLQARAGASF